MSDREWWRKPALDGQVERANDSTILLLQGEISICMSNLYRILEHMNYQPKTTEYLLNQFIEDFRMKSHNANAMADKMEQAKS
jgi:hypothetical protein